MNPLHPEVLRAGVHAWIDAWNRHDLDAILEHYTDDIALCSPRVVERLGFPDGWLHGKATLRGYFARGLENPALRFEFVALTLGVGHLTVVYRREDGTLVTDTAELSPDGRVRRMVACYGSPPR